MDEARIIELETRLAYQEGTLRDLNDVIARQQKQIDRLEQLCRMLAERILGGPQEGNRNTPEEEIPPHY